MMAVALLLGTGLTAALPGVSVRSAEAADDVELAAAHGASRTLSDEFFRVEWTVSPGRQSNSRITGYVYNLYGEEAEKVQLRISEMDASGRVVASVTRPVFGSVPGEDRAYFEVQVPNSPSYRVTVESFDFEVGS